MSIDPQFYPPDPPLESPAYLEEIPDWAPTRVVRIPHIGHTLLFIAIAGASMLLIQLLAYGLAVGLHFFPHETNSELMREPRLLIPTMFLSYFVGGLLCIIIFSAVWHRPFADGVRWDLKPVSRHLWLLIVTGVVVSIGVQLLSNFLPIPKELPIDDFFRTPVDVWMVAIFGVFVAPVFEELAFRGFLLPSLASAWDWMTGKLSDRIRVELAALQGAPLTAFAPITDPKWSPAAIFFASTLTSICFALLHADQLAHAWAPLGVLFCVSLVLCAVRLRFHSLAASALVHACYNGTIFAMLFFATSGFRHLDKLKQ
jgi:membrane protease YdiL (CAAX protease family)